MNSKDSSNLSREMRPALVSENYSMGSQFHWDPSNPMNPSNSSNSIDSNNALRYLSSVVPQGGTKDGCAMLRMLGRGCKLFEDITSYASLLTLRGSNRMSPNALRLAPYARS